MAEKCFGFPYYVTENFMNPLKKEQTRLLNCTGNADLARKIDEIITWINAQGLEEKKEKMEMYSWDVDEKMWEDKNNLKSHGCFISFLSDYIDREKERIANNKKKRK
jgi:hypothetical protein